MEKISFGESFLDQKQIKLWDKYSGDEKYNYFGKFFHVYFADPPDDAVFSSNGQLYAKKPRLFTFICEHSPQEGHGMIVEVGHKPTPDFFGLPSGQREIMTMVELDWFRKATLEEC